MPRSYLKFFVACMVFLLMVSHAQAQYVSAYNNSFTGPNTNRAKEEANNRQMRDDQEKWRQKKYAEEAKANRYSSSGTGSYEPKVKTPGTTKTVTIPEKPKSKYDYVYPYIDGLAEARLNGKSGFIDWNENVVVPLIYEDIRMYSEGLVAVKLNGKYGYIDTKGKVVIPYNYDNAGQFEEGKAMVLLNKKETYINKSGALLFPFKYDDLYPLNNVMVHASLNGKMGFIDYTGKEIIPVKYDSVTYLVKDGKKMFLNGLHYYFDKAGKPMKDVYDYVSDNDEYGENFVELNNKWGKTDKTGKIVIPLNYDRIMLTENGMTGVYRNNKWGFVNRAGKEIITPKFDSVVSNFNKKGMAVISNSGKMFSIDKLGKITKALNGLPWGKDQDDPWRTSKFAEFYDAVGSFNNGLAQVNKNNKWGFINTKGEVVLPVEYDMAYSFAGGLCIVKNNNKYGFVNLKNEIVLPLQYDDLHHFQSGKAPVKIGEKWGYMNIKGSIIVPAAYDEVAYSFQEGLALVKKGGDWGYIDTTGAIIVPFKYAGGEDFSNGLACVYLWYKGESLMGFINANDVMVIEPQFEYLVKFKKNGTAIVMKKGTPYIIDKTGKFIKKLTMDEYYKAKEEAHKEFKD